jgi:uncharacterized protein (TIGR03067 family)
MQRSNLHAIGAGLLVLTLAVVASADEAKDAAIKKDRQQLAGTWRIMTLEVNGNKAKEEDAKKLTVINGSDDTWVLFSEGKEVGKGTNDLDPTTTPKKIDLTVMESDGQTKVYPGIYELGDQTRKLCFAPAGKDRPTEFTTTPGSEHILVVFEREKKE